ncbi:helix-turn-helix transcriptional regulator [Paenibacillus glufosinatiresistens]|uniref:helix-turn-helix transcriptional regulator n=1 Tax=Paenibacillus glufosinatiresistens TaxID=3070657 RepID=UPI00286DA4F2|nr:helix-turn-helix transcriptional regulator [Paenibacillus sp. YX.27]
MPEEVSYTTEEVAKLLKISKLKVYDLIKKGELPSYRVGKQMRVDASDLELYKRRSREGGAPPPLPLPQAPSAGQGLPPWQQAPGTNRAGLRDIVITGQDMSLDILAQHLERSSPSMRPLRSYAGSLDSLISMYRGESDIVSTHLLDGDTGAYNLPYVRRLLVGLPFLIVRLLTRSAGLYVAKGNPKGITGWEDLARSGYVLVNRERGSGARVLLDEQLRLLGLSSRGIEGYRTEETSHLAVAAKVARGEADIGVGTLKAAKIVEGVDFIPLIEEEVDLVMIRSEENEGWIQSVLGILRSPAFRRELSAIHGCDTRKAGTILYEAEYRQDRSASAE